MDQLLHRLHPPCDADHRAGPLYDQTLLLAQSVQALNHRLSAKTKQSPIRMLGDGRVGDTTLVQLSRQDRYAIVRDVVGKNVSVLMSLPSLPQQVDIPEH